MILRRIWITVDFNILTDSGKRFCSCRFENGSIWFIGKNGSVCLEDVVQQIVVRDPRIVYARNGRDRRCELKQA